MNPSNHSDQKLCALHCSLRREQIRFRRLKGRYLELKKSNPDIRIDFFECTQPCPKVTTNKAIPEDRLQQDMIDELAKIMSDLFMFMSKYERRRMEHPDFKINFVEAIKSKHIIMN